MSTHWTDPDPGDCTTAPAGPAAAAVDVPPTFRPAARSGVLWARCGDRRGAHLTVRQLCPGGSVTAALEAAQELAHLAERGLWAFSDHTGLCAFCAGVVPRHKPLCRYVTLVRRTLGLGA